MIDMKQNKSYLAIQVLILVAGLFGTFLACDSIHEAFRYWPEIAYFEPFVFISCVLECLAVLIVAIVLFSLLQQLLENSRDKINVKLYLKIASYVAVIADIYLLIAVAIFWMVTGLMHPSILLGYLLITLFVCCFILFCRQEIK